MILNLAAPGSNVLKECWLRRVSLQTLVFPDPTGVMVFNSPRRQEAVPLHSHEQDGMRPQGLSCDRTLATHAQNLSSSAKNELKPQPTMTWVRP